MTLSFPFKPSQSSISPSVMEPIRGCNYNEIPALSREIVISGTWLRSSGQLLDTFARKI